MTATTQKKKRSARDTARGPNSHDLFEGLFEFAPDAILVVDARGRINRVNSQAERMFGYRRDELVGRPVEDLVPNEVRVVHQTHRRDYAAHPHRRRMGEGLTLLGCRRDGTRFPIEVALGPFDTVQGPTVLCVARDVTDRVRSEEALRRTHEDLEKRVIERTAELTEQVAVRARAERRLALQYAVTRALATAESLETAAPELLAAACNTMDWELGELWLLGPDRQLLTWFDSWSSLGAAASEFEAVSRQVTFRRGEGLPGRAWASHEALWLKDVAQDADFLRGTAARALGLHAALVFPIETGGNVTGVLALFSRDLRPPDDELLSLLGALGSQIGQFVARLQAEHGLREAHASLTDANRRLVEEQAKVVQAEKLSSIGRLAAGVAHEINNPLSGVMGCVKSLLDESVPDTRRAEYLETVRDGLERMRLTVRGLLDYARQRPPAPSEVDVADIADACLRLAGPAIRDKELSIDVRLAPGAVSVRADRSQLMQGLMNVLLNAVHATPPGGRIAVTAHAQAGRVGIRIADTGIGIPRELLDRVCDPFFTTKPEGEGTGLGLAVTLGIAKAHGGELTIDSEPGRGTNVTLWLPST